MNTSKKATLSAESALFVGDTHADAGWLKSVVLPTARKMSITTIIQVGDFGYWPESRKFLNVVRTARAKFGVDVWFIDGNHEHFTTLNRNLAAAQVAAGVPEGDRDPVELSPGFIYLPRGSRITVAGRSVACVGGAASIDRADRIEGKSWFPEERINNVDIEAVAAGGHADILITHDAPAGWHIPGVMSEGPLPNSWYAELTSCYEHRERVREVLELVITPSTLIHGHYHTAYQQRSTESWGTLDTFGLDCNESQRWGVAVREVDGELSFEWVGDDSSSLVEKLGS
ncbi:MAG: metallophosphoesterase family protein [Acidimicrobiales bacterium]